MSEETKTTTEHSKDNPKDNGSEKMFMANNKYFTIAIYSVIVILVGVFIIRIFLSWNETMDGMKKIGNILMPFFVGGLIAYILNPAVKRISLLLRRIFKLKEGKLCMGLSIAITYLLGIGLIAVALFGIIPQLITSIMELVTFIPKVADDIYNFVDNLEEHFPGVDMNVVRDIINDAIPDMINYMKNFATNLVPAIYSISKSIVVWILNVFISVMVSIYMLTDKKSLLKATKKLIYGFVPVRHINSFLEILREGNRLFSSFIIGKSIDSLIIGVLCFIMMTILRLDYSVLISVIIGITNMIPYFGPFIGAVPGVLILLLVSPFKALILAILILVLQQFDGLILGPRILGDSTGLSPLWIIIAITIGGSIAGVLGMFLGVPIAAFIRYLISRSLTHRLQKRGMESVNTTPAK